MQPVGLPSSASCLCLLHQVDFWCNRTYPWIFRIIVLRTLEQFKNKYSIDLINYLIWAVPKSRFTKTKMQQAPGKNWRWKPEVLRGFELNNRVVAIEWDIEKRLSMCRVWKQWLARGCFQFQLQIRPHFNSGSMTFQNSEQYKPANSDTQSSLPAQFFHFPHCVPVFSFAPSPLSFFSFSATLLSASECYSRPSFILFAQSAESLGSRCKSCLPACRRRRRRARTRGKGGPCECQLESSHPVTFPWTAASTPTAAFV